MSFSVEPAGGRCLPARCKLPCHIPSECPLLRYHCQGRSIVSTHRKGVWADHLVCWWGWGCFQSSNLLFALLCYWDQHIPSLESGHWSTRWWVGCGWPVEERAVAGLCLVGSSNWSLGMIYLPWTTTLMAKYSLSSPDLSTSTAGAVFRTKVTIPPLCRSALSCRKSSYPLRMKQWASVMWVSWMQMMSTPSLLELL